MRCRPTAEAPRLEDFCERTTWHGVSDFYKSKGVLRLFWALAMISAGAAAAYGCYAIIHQYIVSPVVISYMIHPADDGRDLPDVVVCPFNRFNASFLHENGIDDNLTEYIQLAFSLNTPYKFADRVDDPRSMNHTELDTRFHKMLKRLGNLTFLDFINRASFSCRSLVRYCVVGKLGIVDCCANATYVIAPVGKCYRLKGVKQVSSGYGFGMTVMIHVPDDQYLSVGKSNLHNDGVSIKLAEKDKGLDFDLTFIPAGVHALMPLRATKYDFINDPPRYECLTHVSDSYSSIRCFDNCFFEPGMTACNCSHVTSTNRSYEACTTRRLYECLIVATMQAMVRGSQGNGTDYVKRCHSLCKPACKFWQFYPTVSYARFPTSTFKNYIDSSFHQDVNWKKVIFLDVFYEKLEYTWIKHYPAMTPDTFIANIGGQVGLWVGGSVLSLAQVVIFGLQYICSRIINGYCADSNAARRPGRRDRQDSSLNGEIPVTARADFLDLDQHREARV